MSILVIFLALKRKVFYDVCCIKKIDTLYWHKEGSFYFIC